jgi:hypothetical protein
MAVTATLVAGCASWQDPFQEHLSASAPQVRECARWYVELDRMVEAGGVRDAQQARVPGFPYMRVDRTLASLSSAAAESVPAFNAYAERLVALDLEARAYELQNLPGGAEPGAAARTRDCARLLRELDLAKPQRRAAILRAAQVPDDYSTAARVIGLYPVTRLLLAAGLRRWETERLVAFEGPVPADTVRFAPAPVAAMPRAEIAALLAQAHLDPLKQPLVSEDELAAIAPLYAPSFEIAIEGNHDRFGALRWDGESLTLAVDSSRHVVYVQPAYTRYGARVLLQLVYTVWFPERPARGALDLFGGRLDGIVWRVTLGPDGEPLVYDSMHPCGCYHQFFPTPRARLRPAPDLLQEWAFVPQELPRVAEGMRPLLTLASGTHHIERVALVHGIDSLSRYELRAYDGLRSMPRPDGGRRSAFGPDGLVAGSARLKRFLLWPAGVASAGAMRQWGRHATALLGRRHFDDAALIERRFVLDLAP